MTAGYYRINDADRGFNGYAFNWLDRLNSFNANGKTGYYKNGQLVYDDPNYVPFSQRPLETSVTSARRELPVGVSAGVVPAPVNTGNPNAEMMVVLPDGRRVPKSVYMASLTNRAPVAPVRANANRDVNNVYSEAYANANRPVEITPWEYYQKYVARG